MFEDRSQPPVGTGASKTPSLQQGKYQLRSQKQESLTEKYGKGKGSAKSHYIKRLNHQKTADLADPGQNFVQGVQLQRRNSQAINWNKD